MKKGKGFLSLRQVFLRLILFRLFLPLLILGMIAIVGVAYFGEKNLETQQNQIAQSMVQLVDYHLDQGRRILDSIGRIAESSVTES